MMRLHAKATLELGKPVEWRVQTVEEQEAEAAARRAMRQEVQVWTDYVERLRKWRPPSPSSKIPLT